MSTTIPQYPLVLVLDIGSSSTRTALYDSSATLIAGSLVREKSTFTVAPDGTATDDPHAVLQRLTRCIDQTMLVAGPHAKHIAAVGCATYAANVCGLDAQGQPCTPVFTYADTRSTDAAAALRARIDEQAVLQLTGCPLRPSYWPALFAWLNEAHPQLLATARRWRSLSEWLLETFFGASSLTYSFAAWTGLLNRHSLAWDTEVLHELPIQADQLGELADVGRAFAGLREPWRSRWPALANIPWYGAVGDGAAANLGSGCVNGARIGLSVGTSGALRVVVPAVPVVPSGLWCYRVDQTLPLLGGATSEGGNVLTWALQTLRLDAPALNQHLLSSVGAGHGLAVLPFVAGERSPGWSGDARATITGIGVGTTALDIGRAALEGVTYRWAHIAALLHTAIGGSAMVVASGGGLKYVPAWSQLIADVLGLPVALSAEAETTSRGVALLALRSLGIIERLEALPVTLQVLYQPDPDRHMLHRAAREQQTDLYRRIHSDS